ncbi:hypothetical protein [Lactobacillus amylovorus]|jgi:phage FluMu protein Com|uniref:hypothetical protein n=1 Tax=Lactobacillus amylovorus TaxID=1604 RepID=UPI003CFDC4FC
MWISKLSAKILLVLFIKYNWYEDFYTHIGKNKSSLRKELLKMLVSEEDYNKEFEGDSEFVRCVFCHKKYFRKEILRVPEFETLVDDICPYCKSLNNINVSANVKYINCKLEDIDN